MSDNANKMGTSMEMIQNAYQGFAKQNYTMLDNLKLGYGGTKEEMARLIEDAAKLSDTVDAQDMSFANIVKAINVVQTEMGITGTTAKEAGSTIQGSVGMMKSAWQNLITGIADENANLDVLISNFVDSVGTVATNLIPKIGTALNGASKLIQGIVPVIIEQIPALVEKNLPTLLTAAVGIIEGLADGILSVLSNDAFLDSIINIILQLVNVLTNPDMIYKLTGAALKIIVAIGKGLIVAIPELLKSIPKIIDAIVRAFGDFLNPIMDIGKNIIEGIKKGISNAWNNLVSWFKGLFGDLIGIAKKILGIASPSKVFKKIGGFTAEGFGAGFEDEFAKVKGDMEDALNFDDASVGINASIRKVGAGAAGGDFGGTSFGDVYINIDGANYSDPQGLAVAVAQELQNMTDRRLAVYA
jgi:phage-related protein